MCYFNRLTSVTRWLPDYPEWVQFCWDFEKPPRNDETALQKFFFVFACSSARIFFYFISAACIFFLPTTACRIFFLRSHHPPHPQELNGRPLNDVTSFCEYWTSVLSPQAIILSLSLSKLISIGQDSAMAHHHFPLYFVDKVHWRHEKTGL